MKFFFISLLLVVSTSLFAQRTVTLTEDLVLTETLVIDEATTYEGNGFRIICNGCNPMIRVTTNERVHFEDVIFKKGYERWLRVSGGDMSNVTWNSSRMTGFIRQNGGE